MDFLKVKTKFVKQVKINKFRENELQRVVAAETWRELQEVIIDNIWWCNKNGILLPDGYYKNQEKEFTVVNGKLNGLYVSYFDNGQVEVKCNYVNSKLNGEFLEYYSDGKIHIKCNYVKNKKHGEFVLYHDNGQVYEKSNFFNDKYHGEHVCYYKNGEIRWNIRYIHNKEV
jgi:antitoxin component YwqK of YwqJK toxin-antitoxin module